MQFPYQPTTKHAGTATRDQPPAYDESGKPPEYCGEQSARDDAARADADREWPRTTDHCAESESEGDFDFDFGTDPAPSIHAAFVRPDFAISPTVLNRLRLHTPSRPTFRVPIVGREPDGLRVSVAEAIMTPTDRSRANSRCASPEPSEARELERVEEVADGGAARPA